jgi:DNA-binding MarR family transcriptional regulator
MRMSVDAIRARMLERLHERGFGDVVTAHLVVLGYPGPEGLRPTELAARTGMTKQALNYLLGQMEELGYLTREPDPGDLRSRRIRLTARGARAVRVMRDAVREVEEEWSAALGPGRLELLRELLIDLRRAAA